MEKNFKCVLFKRIMLILDFPGYLVVDVFTSIGYYDIFICTYFNNVSINKSYRVFCIW